MPVPKVPVMVSPLMLIGNPLHLTELLLRQSNLPGHQPLHVLLYEFAALLRRIHLTSILLRQGYHDVEIAL